MGTAVVCLQNNEHGFAFVESVKPGSPSEGKVQAGDIFYKLDGASLYHLTSADVMKVSAGVAVLSCARTVMVFCSENRCRL